MAAAYAALVSLFNDLELIHNHPRHSFSFEDKQIQSLLHIVTLLIEFVESYDNAHGPSKEAAQLLEKPITRAAHAAEEVIESHVVDQIRSGSTLDGKRRPRFLLDVQKVIEDMEFVRRRTIKVSKALNQPTYPAATAAASSSSTPLTSDKTSIVGFEDVLAQLLDLLTGYPSSLRVIPIVGTGGIGKTTLAKYAFENTVIVGHFDVCLWATISQEYVIEDILLRLLSRDKKSDSETVVELGEQLHKNLYGRRYLVVLDNMWSVEVWDQLKFFCPDTSNGSRVVVTTRLSNVGDCIGSSSLAISFLAEDKSWDLFCVKAFGGHGCPVELEAVGKKIVKKCKGLPLAIVVVAGHLGKSSRKKEYWVSVANNMNSVLNSDENKQFLDILSFSYSHLPARLKPCFIYMGTRREDEEIDMGDLIQLWTAEGFLKPCEDKNLEEIAEDYLNDLIDRNLIFRVAKSHRRLNFYGEMNHVGIHDALRELCIKDAEREKFFHVVDRARKRVICREREAHVLDGRRSAPPPVVRCLQWKEGDDTDEHSFDLRLLRVLDKEERRESVNEVDEGFLKADQVNLRYLKYTGYRTNPPCLYIGSQISLFWNLQNLVIDLWLGNCVAPYEFWEMLQLRNLDVYPKIYLPDPLPSENLEQVMQNLQTLKRVENLRLSDEVCKRIPNIKELELIYFDTAVEFPSSDYCLHNLVCFRKLESLDCTFGWSDRVGLKLPSSLKKLLLNGSRLDWEEITMMVGSLPHLETLDLQYKSVKGSSWTLVEKTFPRLKYLTIMDCDGLVEWNADRSNFPVLEYLCLGYMLRLDELPSFMGQIPTLGCIRLRYCSESLMISAARIVMESQEEYGNQDLKLQIECDTDEAERFNKKLQEEVVKAREVFDGMSSRNLVNWNSLISGYVQICMCKEALEAFTKMQEDGFEPDGVTLVSVMSACAQTGNLDVGKEIHERILSSQIELNVFFVNALVDMYAKCGDLGTARLIFEGALVKTSATWNSLITGFAIHGQCWEAIEFFGRMKESGVKPDEVTFLSVLSACAHGGLVEEGLESFSRMEKYGVKRNRKHYGCLVDLLGRAGRLQDAFNLVKGMPVDLNDTVLGALLGACRTHSDTIMTQKVMEFISELSHHGSHDEAHYLLLSNIYAASERWEMAERVRVAFSARGSVKTTGCSVLMI